MPSERDFVLHSWCVPGDWNAPTVVGGRGASLVLEDGRDLYCLAVDRVLGYQEVVVKPLGDPLERLAWFSGATVLGAGRPVLILDMPKALRPRAA